MRGRLPSGPNRIRLMLSCVLSEDQIWLTFKSGLIRIRLSWIRDLNEFQYSRAVEGDNLVVQELSLVDIASHASYQKTSRQEVVCNRAEMVSLRSV